MQRTNKLELLKLIQSGRLSSDFLRISAGDAFLKTDNGKYSNKAGFELSYDELNKVPELTEWIIVLIYLKDESKPYSICVTNRPIDSPLAIRLRQSAKCSTEELCKELISLFEGETRDLSEMTTDELKNRVRILRKIEIIHADYEKDN